MLKALTGRCKLLSLFLRIYSMELSCISKRSGLFIVVVMTAFILMACTKDRVTPRPALIPGTPTNTDTTVAKTMLALGDSYTIGSSVSIEERFPVQTRTRLVQAGLKLNSPTIVAVSGWTTGNLLNAVNQAPPGNNYDIVTLLIGVNNQYQGRSQDEYRIEFASLLEKAIAYAGGRRSRVFVLSIPDYSVTPFAQNSDTAKIAREIDAFNTINKQITLAASITYLDITGISRDARRDPTLIAGDGLHPSGKQYERWTALLVPIIQAAL